MIRTILTLTALALITAQTATAAPLTATGLETRLPTPTQVYCTTNVNGPAWADIPGRAIYLDSTDCQSLLHETPQTYAQTGLYSWAQHAHTLLHEWVHIAFQTRDEKQVEAITFTLYRYWLRSYWGFAPLKAQNFYDATVGFSAYAPIAYTRTAVDPLL